MDSTPSDDTTDARFSTYGRSLADLLAGLLRQGDGSRVADREQVRTLWRRRYPEMAAMSLKRTSRRPSAANDTEGARAKNTLNQAYRALEKAGVISRRDAATVSVVNVPLLIQVANQYMGSDATFSSGPSTLTREEPVLTEHDTRIQMMASHLRDHLVTQASNAESHASDGGDSLRSMSATRVGALAYLQHGLSHVRTLFARELAKCVRDEGMTAEELAEGLAEHGISTTAAEIRATYPQVVAMERQVRWLMANGATYLPLLHLVSRLTLMWPTLVGGDHRDKAQEVHRLISASLSDTSWDGTHEGLDRADLWLFIMYGPSEQPWLSHMTVEVLPHGSGRESALALQRLVAEYYELGHADVTPSGDRVDDDHGALAGDPLEALRVSVARRSDPVPLHVAGRALS